MPDMATPMPASRVQTLLALSATCTPWRRYRLLFVTRRLTLRRVPTFIFDLLTPKKCKCYVTVKLLYGDDLWRMLMSRGGGLHLFDPVTLTLYLLTSNEGDQYLSCTVQCPPAKFGDDMSSGFCVRVHTYIYTYTHSPHKYSTQPLDACNL